MNQLPNKEYSYNEISKKMPEAKLDRKSQIYNMLQLEAQNKIVKRNGKYR